MKVLILSITAGQGHNQCGMSLCKYLQELGAKAEMIDALEYISPILSEGLSKGYLMTTKYSPTAYGGFYRLFEKKTKQSAKNISIIQGFLKKLKDYILNFRPDVVICTHIFSAQFMTSMKDIPAKTIGIITDFTIHPFWEDTDLDYYVTASELLNWQAMKKGIDIQKIKPFGIPIHEKFSTKISKSEAREKLGIEDKLTMLVMSGSMGYGNIIKQIRRLNKLDMNLQIITVCGNNHRQKERIDKMKINKTIYNYGYVDNVDLLMDAADCIVTKPGGLTTSEALAKGVPLIMVDPIPGQEERNEEFLLNNGVALKISSTYPLDECLFELFSNEWRIRYLVDGVRFIGKGNATKDLVNFIMGLQ